MKRPRLHLGILLGILSVIAYSFVLPSTANAQPGPVAYWPFNEATDSVLIDSSGNGNTAYIHSATRVPGVSGNALSFNGTSDYAHANHSASLTINNQISIECWVNVRTSGGNQTVIRKNNAYVLGIGTGGKIGFWICDETGSWHGSWTLSSQAIQTSAWYHIAGVWDGQTMRVYINGMQDPTTYPYSGTGPSASYTNAIYIGENYEQGNIERLNGILDELKVYNYALPTDSIVPILIPYTPNPTYNRRPLLRWYANDSIPLFRIQIAKNQQFSSPIVSDSTTDTFYTPAADLPFGTSYWRVGNEADTSLWSAFSSVNIYDSTPISGSLFMAVGGVGIILTSPDGITWTGRVSVTTGGLSSVTWTGSKFVAVGGTTAFVSSDGITWSSHSSGASGSLSSVIWTGSQLVAVGGFETDPGMPTHGSTGIVYTSPDGIIWTNKWASSGGWLYSVTRTDSQCVAVGGTIMGLTADYYDNIITSPDGNTWTTRINGSNMCNYFSVTWTGSQLVAVGSYGSLALATFGVVFTSPDGITWTKRPMGNNNNLYSVTFGKGQLVAVGYSGVVLTSPNGITWTSRTSGNSNKLNSVCFGNGRYVAVGGSGTVLTSPDGITWTTQSSGTTNTLNSVIWIDSTLYTATKPIPKTVAPTTFLKVQACNSRLMVSLPSTMLGKSVDFAVYSVSGREIMRKRVKSGAERFTVPVSFPYGSYILVANDGIRKASVRFVADR